MAGPITIPPDVAVTVGKDGTISTVSNETRPGPSTVLGRLKLVNPPSDTLKRSEQGLFISKNNQPVEADANVVVIGGALESSNVNVVESMVNMISLARQFEMQMKMLENAQNNEGKASQLFNMNA